MEAATPLRKPDVRVVGDALVVDGLTVTDETVVRVVREGDNPAGTVADAIEIGARMLDREQVAANTEFVKTEFEKVSKEVETAFSDKARETADQFDRRFEEMFDPEQGTLAAVLKELFSDGSSKAVQNRVKEIVTEVAAKSREDMVRAFSTEDGHNPLTDFKAAILGRLEVAEKRQTPDRPRAAAAARGAAAGGSGATGGAREGGGARGRARAGDGQGADLRGAGGRGGRRAGSRPGRLRAGCGRREGSDRQDGRRGRGHRRRQRPRAGAPRVRGQGPPAHARPRRSPS